jgi:hypothetical protein
MPVAAALGIACADPPGGGALPAEALVDALDNYFDPNYGCTNHEAMVGSVRVD